MSFKLNTKSGFLHKEGHGGEGSTESFERADAADLWAHKNNLDLQWCSTCFDNDEQADLEQAREDEISAEPAPGYEGDTETDTWDDDGGA